MISSRQRVTTVRIFDRLLGAGDDILDHDRLRLAADGCDTVIHLAAKVGLGVDISDIDAYALQNDVGTAMTLRVAAEQQISRFVYASSMVVYGEGRYRCGRHGLMSPPPRDRNDLDQRRFDPRCPGGADLVPQLVPESAPLDPRNTYAATKVHGEQLAAIWSRETGGHPSPLCDFTTSTVPACRATPRTRGWHRSSLTVRCAANRRGSSRMAVGDATSSMCRTWQRP